MLRFANLSLRRCEIVKFGARRAKPKVATEYVAAVGTVAKLDFSDHNRHNLSRAEFLTDYEI